MYLSFCQFNYVSLKKIDKCNVVHMNKMFKSLYPLLKYIMTDQAYSINKLSLLEVNVSIYIIELTSHLLVTKSQIYHIHVFFSSKMTKKNTNILQEI